MPFLNINSQPEISVFDGVKIQTIHGEKIMLSYVHLEPHSIVAEHSHPHEQMGMVLEGTFELTIDGESRTLNKGDTYLIPSNIKHSAKAFHSPAIALDIFSPPREDYIK
ncbi:cupin domain-containing protein [Candidatus Poribacteria bacterium]|nr:cupin domain-containing protein [Candidatus Poribacteria bacterium]